MISGLFKILLLLNFAIIYKQDKDSRLVYWFLYPSAGLLCFLNQINYNSVLSALINSIVNLGFVAIILLTCYGYSQLKIRKPFLKNVLGVGDILFFVAISFSFSTVSFLVLFVFGLIFSLLLHLVMKDRSNDPSVPLAGYLSLFYGFVYLINFIFPESYLYQY